MAGWTLATNVVLKWRSVLVDPTPLYDDLEKGSKENLRTPYDYMEKDKETHNE